MATEFLKLNSKPLILLLKIFLLIAVFFCKEEAIALGSLINIDFKTDYPSIPTYIGKGILGQVQDSRWNGIKQTTSTDISLIDSKGAPSSATFSSTGIGGSFSLRFGFTWGNFSDFWYLNNTTKAATLKIQKLKVGESFDLILYCHAGDNGQVMKAKVNDGAEESTSGQKTGVIQWSENPHEKSNYMRFTGTVPASGELTISLSSLTNGNIQGLQLQLGQISSPVGTRTYKLIPDLAAGYNLKVLTIGTSLTDMPYGESWPSQLYSALFPKYQGHMILSNRAISGSNSKSGVANIENWIAMDKPDVVFIEYSMNDAVARDNITIENMKANLDFICSKILGQNPKAQIILQTMNNTVGPALVDRPKLEEYYQGYRDYAQAKGYLLVDNYPLWKKAYETNPTQWEKYVPDRLHPNDLGRDSVMIRNLVATLESELNPDNVSPSVPTNLATTEVTSLSVSFTWASSTDNVGVKSYDIFDGDVLKGTSSTNAIKINGLTPNTTYRFSIRARDNSNNISERSTVLIVTTGSADLQSPSAPLNLNFSDLSSNSVKLTWNASTDNVGVVGYDVYSDGTFAGSSVQTSFIVTGLKSSTTYNFTVKARDEVGNASQPSVNLKITTLAAAEVVARGENLPSEGIDKLTDGNINTKWLDFNSTSWVIFSYPSGRTLNTYQITSGDDAPDRDPKDWTIQGSNDNISWTTLDSRTNHLWSERKETRSFTFTNNTSYKFYKWDITANGGATMIQSSEFQFNGIVTDVEEVVKERLVIYPNPVSDKLNLNVDIGKLTEVSIYDLQGGLILSKTIYNEGSPEVDIEELNGGLYYLKVKQGDKILNSKFMKE